VNLLDILVYYLNYTMLGHFSLVILKDRRPNSIKTKQHQIR